MTKIELLIILTMVIGHYIFDFIVQTREEGKGKSKDFGLLLDHTVTYSLYWIIPTIIYIIITGNWWMSLFPPVTFIFHTITDYYTSKTNAQLYADHEEKAFWNSIGLDQLLHYSQLFTTFFILQ